MQEEALIRYSDIGVLLCHVVIIWLGTIVIMMFKVCVPKIVEWSFDQWQDFKKKAGW
ncbi:MAG: hypothetical protein AAB407_02865 [Patescibacteria group bacterium]